MPGHGVRRHAVEAHLGQELDHRTEDSLRSSFSRPGAGPGTPRADSGHSLGFDQILLMLCQSEPSPAALGIIQGRCGDRRQHRHRARWHPHPSHRLAGHQDGFAAPLAVVALIVAIVLGVTRFVVMQRRSRAPMAPLSVPGESGRRVALIVMVIMGAVIAGASTSLPCPQKDALLRRPAQWPGAHPRYRDSHGRIGAAHLATPDAPNGSERAVSPADSAPPGRRARNHLRSLAPTIQP